MRNNDQEILQCPNGSFCCHSQNSTCCEDGQGLWIDNSTYALLNYDPALRNTSTSSSNTSSTSNNTTSNPTNDPADTSGSNVAAIAGGTAGGVAGLLALLGLAFIIWRRKRRSSRKDSGADNAHNAELETSWEKGEMDGNALVEMDGNDRLSRNMELEGSDPRNIELESPPPISQELEGRPIGNVVSSRDSDSWSFTYGGKG